MTTKQQIGRTDRRAPPAWISIGGGKLAVGHRPKARAFRELQESGCTHVVTLLGERERASELRDQAQGAGLVWLWLPLENGDPLPHRRDPEVLAIFEQIKSALAGGGGVLIHCSAGIHRTGMITYAFLRHLGHDAPRAREVLRELRQITADGVGDSRLAWGDRFGSKIGSHAV